MRVDKTWERKRRKRQNDARNENYITGCKPTQQQLNKLKTLKNIVKKVHK